MTARGGAGRTLAAKLLTARLLETIKPGLEPLRIKDARTPGLSIRIATDGAITFYVSARIKGSGETFSKPIGRFPRDLSLQEARDRADEITKAARAGRNLLREEEDARREAARALTVEQLIAAYIKGRVKGKLRTADEIGRRLTRALAPIADKMAESVRRRDIRELLDEVAEDGREREAEKRRQTIGAMFRWAIAKDMIETDPTAGLPVYDPGRPRDRVLSEEEIRSLLHFLNSDSVPRDHANALRLQLLIGARIGEITGMTLDEIDADNWIWTLPAARSKNKKPRATPIDGWAREIVVHQMKGTKRDLFRTERGTTLSSSTLGAWLKTIRHKVIEESFGTHDIRRTVATALDDLGIARDVIGAIVGHESGDKSTAVLRRHYLKTEAISRKRIALGAWEARLRQIYSGGSAQNVIPLRQ